MYHDLIGTGASLPYRHHSHDGHPAWPCRDTLSHSLTQTVLRPGSPHTRTWCRVGPKTTL